MGSPQVRYWQLAALLAVVLPQFERLPYWLSGVVVLACLWRLPVVEQRGVVGEPFDPHVLLGE